MTKKKRTTTALTAGHPQRVVTTPAAKAGTIGSFSPGDAWVSGLDMTGYLYRHIDAPTGWIQAVKGNVWARRCVRARANAFASVPLKLWRKTDDPKVPEEVTEHDILTLLEDVNPVYLDRASFREQVQKQRCIAGEAYISLVIVDSKPAELYVLPAHLVQPIPDPVRLVAGFTYNGAFYDRESIIRWYYMDSSEPIKAESPTSTAIRAINRYNIADIAAEAIDSRGGRGGGIIAANIPIQNEDGLRMVREWNDLNADPNRAGEDRFLPSGTDYKTGTLSAQQQQREERADRLKKEIFAAYEVPPAKANDYSDASVLANADQQDADFWGGVMTYELTSFEDCLNYYLLWRFWPEAKEQGLFLKHDLSGIAALQEDEAAKAGVLDTKLKTAVMGVSGGVWSLNEAREYTGKATIEHALANNPETINEANAAQAQAEAEQAKAEQDAKAQADQQVAQVQEGDAGDDAPDALDNQTANLILTISTAVVAGEISEEAGEALIGLVLPTAPEDLLSELVMTPDESPDEVGEMEGETPDPEADALESEADALIAEAGDEPVDAGTPDEMAMDDPATKANYNAGAGETIAGNLARGSGGKFTAGSGGGSSSGGKNLPKPRPDLKDWKQAAGGGEKKKGKGKDKKTEAQKEAEKKAKSEKKAAEKQKKNEERAAKLEGKKAQLQAALEGLQGKDDPSNLRKRISQALGKLDSKIKKLRNPDREAEDDLLDEAATKAEITPSEIPWIGFYLNTQDALALELEPAIGEMEDRHHITLAMLPNLDPDGVKRLMERLDQWTKAFRPIEASIAGVGVFEQPDARVVYASANSPALTAFYAELSSMLRDFGWEPMHGFTPHITLTYAGLNDDLSGVSVKPINVSLPVLTLGWQGVAWHYLLGKGSIGSTDYAQPARRMDGRTFVLEAGAFDAAKAHRTFTFEARP